MPWLCDTVPSRKVWALGKWKFHFHPHKAEGISLSSPPHGAGGGSWGRRVSRPGSLDGCDSGKDHYLDSFLTLTARSVHL